jgi:site-specific DNA recombinase
MEGSNADRGDLCTGVVGQATEGGTIASQTAELIGFARSHGYQVPKEWVFEDEGYSGASLVRPGLERVRDLASEGQIEAVLVYAPDRLSRNTPIRSC